MDRKPELDTPAAGVCVTGGGLVKQGAIVAGGRRH